LDPEPSLFFNYTVDAHLTVGFVILITLLFCLAIISGAQSALFSLTQKDIDFYLQNYPTKGKIIAQLLEKPKKLSLTLRIAYSFMMIGIVILFSIIGNNLFSAIDSSILKLGLKVVFISFLILFFGEILPKVYANKNKVPFVKQIAYPLILIYKLLLPISLPIRWFSTTLQEKIGKQKSNFSIDQLSQALELTDSNENSSEEQKILEGIVTFGNTETKQVMSPRMDIFAIEIEESFQVIYPKIIENSYSRIPVYRENIDHIEGILFVKDLLKHIDKKEFDWKTLIREPFFVPENKKIDNLLKDFQSMKSHLAIVVDEYGGTSGLVSLEDIIEEIVGDISDEFDTNNLSFTKIDDKNFLFEGKTNLKDFYRILDVNEELFEIHKGEAETLAGFVLEILGNFPKKNQNVLFKNFNFSIESVDNKRIKQIKVTLE
jgi:putative hemolysin